MSTRKLPPGISEELGYYVYLYLDPETDKPFYVGKGKGNRVYAHLYDDSDSEKARTIHRLYEKGLEPIIEILIHGLEDEETAYRVEMAAIDLIGIENLTNSVRGLESGVYGRMALDELIAQIAQPQVEITDPVLLIRINQLFHYGMSAEALYEATRGVWKISERRNGARFAMAVYDGLVREIYDIEQWHSGGTTPYTTRSKEEVNWPERWEFTGKVAGNEVRNRYYMKSVREHFPANMQNPVRMSDADRLHPTALRRKFLPGSADMKS